MYPQVYPMSQVSPGGKVNWSADPDIYPGLRNDIYLYVAGSSYVERKNKQIAQREKERKLGQQTAATMASDSSLSDYTNVQTIALAKGQTISIGRFKVGLKSFEKTSTKGLPDNTIIAVKATLNVRPRASNDTQTLHPLFAIYGDQGKNWSYSPPKQLKGSDVSFRFTNIDPQTGKVTFQVKGIDKNPKKAWILVIAQKKPFISLVWIGTCIVMLGFGISIFRHAERERKRRT
jgi:cytochrome c-type biogenesis protein CcmF